MSRRDANRGSRAPGWSPWNPIQSP
jgi:hypothetical protein